jgi:hypothetical protein
MADASASPRPAVTPRQLLFIAVLGVILAVVLIVQFGGASGGPDDSQGGSRPQAAPSGAAQPAQRQSAAGPQAAGSPAPGVKTAPGTPRPASPPWPKLSGQVAGQYDPFAMPEPLARQAKAQRPDDSPGGKAGSRNPATDPALMALRRKGTDAILRDGQGAVAVIDKRVVRVGDVLQGYRVVSIDDDGVLLAPSPSQDVPEERK